MAQQHIVSIHRDYLRMQMASVIHNGRLAVQLRDRFLHLAGIRSCEVSTVNGEVFLGYDPECIHDQDCNKAICALLQEFFPDMEVPRFFQTHGARLH